MRLSLGQIGVLQEQRGQFLFLLMSVLMSSSISRPGCATVQKCAALMNARKTINIQNVCRPELGATHPVARSDFPGSTKITAAATKIESSSSLSESGQSVGV